LASSMITPLRHPSPPQGGLLSSALINSSTMQSPHHYPHHYPHHLHHHHKEVSSNASPNGGGGYSPSPPPTTPPSSGNSSMPGQKPDKKHHRRRKSADNVPRPRAKSSTVPPLLPLPLTAPSTPYSHHTSPSNGEFLPPTLSTPSSPRRTMVDYTHYFLDNNVLVSLARGDSLTEEWASKLNGRLFCTEIAREEHLNCGRTSLPPSVTLVNSDVDNAAQERAIRRILTALNLSGNSAEKVRLMVAF